MTRERQHAWARENCKTLEDAEHAAELLRPSLDVEGLNRAMATFEACPIDLDDKDLIALVIWSYVNKIEMQA